MTDNRSLPEDPLAFIKECVVAKSIIWTYHVNVRLKKWAIPSGMILEAVKSYEIIEAYPEDKYLPSYLVYAECGSIAIHVLFATDVENQNVRIVTAYRPDPNEWSRDLRRRKKP